MLVAKKLAFEWLRFQLRFQTDLQFKKIPSGPSGIGGSFTPFRMVYAQIRTTDGFQNWKIGIKENWE